LKRILAKWKRPQSIENTGFFGYQWEGIANNCCIAGENPLLE
jgi:hypothetical protein